MNTVIQDIKKEYDAIKTNNPKKRIREIAGMMGLSEAEIVAAHVGTTATLLDGRFQEFLEEAHTLGYVMALTRNDSVVHERKGIYNNVSFEGPVGLALNEDIDLRFFLMHWSFGFAVQEGERKSFQFFDKAGVAVHKIYAQEKTDMAAFDALINKYKAAEQIQTITVAPTPPAPETLPDAAVDKAAFQEAWLALEDTHQFFPLLRKHGLSRTQALRLAPEGYAERVPNDSVSKMLQIAAKEQVAIMVFVGSKGCIQIHTGMVTNLLETGPWYNVLDSAFNLHLKQADIDTTWIVKKPTADGVVTSIEVFDEKEELIVQFFGKRKPGQPELESWRAVIEDLAPQKV